MMHIDDQTLKSEGRQTGYLTVLIGLSLYLYLYSYALQSYP